MTETPERFKIVKGDIETVNTSTDPHIISMKIEYTPNENGNIVAILDEANNKIIAIAWKHQTERISQLKRDTKTLNIYAKDL